MVDPYEGTVDQELFVFHILSSCVMNMAAAQDYCVQNWGAFAGLRLTPINEQPFQAGRVC